MRPWRASGTSPGHDAGEGPAPRPPALWRRLGRHRLFMTGAVILGIMLLLAVFADLLQILPPEKMQVRLRFKTPDFPYPLGTDNYGRDIWSRLVHGARLSLMIGFAVARGHRDRGYRDRRGRRLFQAASTVR